MCRQSDPKFIAILNEIRSGDISNGLLAELDDCLLKNKPRPNDGIVPTMLYCTNKDVDKMNTNQLASLEGDVHELKARDDLGLTVTATARSYLIEALEKQIPASISLKIGAQVMLLRNRPKSTGSTLELVNGSRGVVVNFQKSSITDIAVPVVMFETGEYIAIGAVEYTVPYAVGDGLFGTAKRSQVPLKLAWATTVHKAQGTTLTRAELNFENAFDYGQVYVALSRLTSLRGLWLAKPIKRASIKAHPDVVSYYNSLEKLFAKEAAKINVDVDPVHEVNFDMNTRQDEYPDLNAYLSPDSSAPLWKDRAQII